jgi:hypothetical protein
MTMSRKRSGVQGIGIRDRQAEKKFKTPTRKPRIWSTPEACLPNRLAPAFIKRRRVIPVFLIHITILPESLWNLYKSLCADRFDPRP